MDGLNNPSNPTPTPTPPPAPKDNPPPAPASGNQSSAELDALRAQIANLTKERDTYAKADEDRKTALLSETEKLQKRATDAEAREKAAETKYTESRKRSVVEIGLAKRGCVNPDLAYKALDATQLDLQADGSVKGVDKILDALVESCPYLFGQSQESSTTGSGSAGAGAGASKKRLTAAEISRMSNDEIAQLERDVMAGKIRL